MIHPKEIMSTEESTLESKTDAEPAEKIDPQREYLDQIDRLKIEMGNDLGNKYSMNYCFSTHGYFYGDQFDNTAKMITLKKGLVQDKADFSATEFIRTLYLGYNPIDDTMDADQNTNLPPLPPKVKPTPVMCSCSCTCRYNCGSNSSCSCCTKEDKAVVKPPVSLATARSTILESFKHFQFWPELKGPKKMSKVTFWSENHILMYLSSCYLYKQHVRLFPDGDMHKDRGSDDDKKIARKIVVEELHNEETSDILIKYLKAHCHEEFNGFYEVNSPAYVHYTTAALLNLYDFTIDQEVRDMAEKMLNRIAYLLMLVTDPNTSICVFSGK